VGFAHMATDEVAAAMRGLSAAGEALGAAWQADRSAIAGHESGIGGDALGQAFRGVYSAGSQAVAAAAGQVGPAMVADAAVATRSATEYADADAWGATAIRAAVTEGSRRGGARAV
jgi:hypothetical protein